MQYYSKTLVVAGLAALFSSSALAGVSSVKELQDGSNVTLSGTVDAVDNEREFVLRDKTGTIDVEIDAGQSVVLKKGDKVSVTGKLDKGFFNTDIESAKVDVEKSLSENVSDAIEAKTSLSLEGAEAYHIKDLPKEGLVKLSGTVTDVDNEKEFTIKDSTGSINVDVKSAESAQLTEGAEVTVIGYVDSGAMVKDINATKVLVTASAAPVAANTN